MVKLSRYILVIIGIMAAAIAIPELYWTIFRESVSTPNVIYSRVLDDFMMVVNENGASVRKDTKGNYYTRDEFEQNLPLLFYRQLFTSNKMPDSLKGVAMEHNAIAIHSAYFNLRPVDVQAPRPVMWPLIESKSGRVSLELPPDFFRIKNKIEFIDARSNTIDSEKSTLFNNALTDKGFEFPARYVSGLPTTRKNIDEGYFIKDSSGNLFHLKMVKGQAYVARIDIPSDMRIVHIECVDLRTQEYYAYVFTSDSRIFLIMGDSYRLQQLPVEGYKIFEHRLRVRNDLLNKTISLIGEDHIMVTVIDKDYKVVDTFHMDWIPVHERKDHVLFARLFPFQLGLETANSRFISFDIYRPRGINFMIINVLLVGLIIWLLRRKKRKLADNLIDLGLVLVTGIFGFVATRVFPNKFYD